MSWGTPLLIVHAERPWSADGKNRVALVVVVDTVLLEVPYRSSLHANDESLAHEAIAAVLREVIVNSHPTQPVVTEPVWREYLDEMDGRLAAIEARLTALEPS